MIFINYRIKDSIDLVTMLYKHLVRDFGEKNIFWDKQHLEPGHWPTQLEEAVKRCPVMLSIIGPEWDKVKFPDGHPRAGFPRLSDPEDWVRKEITLALGLHESGHRVIPVCLQERQMPAREWLANVGLEGLAACQGKPLRSDYEHDYNELRTFILKACPALKLQSKEGSSKSQQPHRPIHLPFARLGELFKGRDAFLTTIRSKLKAGRHDVAIVGTQAVHGLGGLGKTRAAVEYAWQHADEYSAVLFVAADRPETLEKNLADLCGPLVLNLPEHNNPEHRVRYAAAVKWLADNPGWFLILDNVDDPQAAESVEELLPYLATGHVLITSRYGDWSGGVERLDLEVLTPAASIEFLRERTQGKRRIEPGDDNAVVELAEQLAGLPLALEQAGAFIDANQESFAGYLSRWRAREQKVLKWFDPVRMKYPHSVAVTWETSFDQLDPASRTLLNLLSWFAPAPIPVAVWQTEAAERAISNGVQRIAAESTVPGKPGDAEDARSGLSRYGLIQWEPDRTAFSVHRLVQEVTRERLSPKEVTVSLNDALSVINDYLPNDLPPWDVRSWPRWNPVRIHVATLIEYACEHKISQPTSDLMGNLAGLLWAKALHQQAEDLGRQALQLDEVTFGPESTQVALRLNNLAQTLKATNRLEDAEPMMRRALAIDERSYGPDHPNVAIRLNNLALLLQDTNRLEEAEPMMRRVLAIDGQTYGPDHPDVAIDLNNLAQLLQDTNRLEEAEPMMRRALAIAVDFKRLTGHEHPSYQGRRERYADLLRSMGRSEAKIATDLRAVGAS